MKSDDRKLTYEGELPLKFFHKNMDFEDLQKEILDKYVIPGDKDHYGRGLFGVLLDNNCLSCQIIDFAISQGFDINKDGCNQIYGGLLNALMCFDNSVDAHFGASNIDILKKLIDVGADLEVVDCERKTALHNSQCIEMTRLLIESGSDIEARDEVGNTPFMSYNSGDIKKALLKAGANPNARDDEGMTILFNLYNCAFALDFFINECGVDPTIKDNRGRMAHEFFEDMLYGVDDDDRSDVLESIEFLKNTVNQIQQKELILEAINEETPIEQKPTQKRRRM